MSRSRGVSPYDESPFKKNNSSMGRRSGRDPTPRNNNNNSNSNLSYGGRRSPPVIESKQFHPSVVHATLSNESGGDHHNPNWWQQDVDNDYSQRKQRPRSDSRGTTPQDNNNMQYSPHYAGDTTSYSNQSWHSGPQSSSHSPSKDSIHNHTNNNIYIANTTSSSYSKGRAITDEYRDYNDELSKQLQLAKYQDELHQREQYEIRKQFINSHNVIGTKYTSPGRRLSSKSPGRRRGRELGRNGVDEMNVGKGNYFTSSYEATPNSNNNIGESSPGGYNATLHSMGVTAVNTPSRSRSRSRKKYPVSTMKQGESQSTTTTTEMTSTTPTLSSRGSHDISMQQQKQQREGRQRQRVGSSGSTISSKPQQQQQQSSFTKVLEAENEQRKREMMNHNGAAPQSAANHNTSMSSWGYTDVQNDINTNGASSTDNNSVSRAFENLSGWPNTNDGTTYVVKKQQQSDAKTPRHGNLTNIDWDDNRHHVGLDPSDDGSSTNAQRRTGPPTPNNNKQYARMQSSLSSTPSLHAISEEQSFGMVGIHPSDDFMSQQHQERRLPPPQPRQHAHKSTNNKKKQYQRGGSGRQDHVVEDVVSIVSYYDDPSIDMGSLATNDDTLTTISTSGPFHRGNSGGRVSPYPGQRMITTKNKKSKRDNSKGRSPPRHDPPGESIDELLQQGIHRPEIDSDGQRPHQGYSPHRFGRDDPSFHGIEPEDYQELMDEDEGDRQQLDNVSPQKKHRHQSFSSQQSPHPPPQLRSSQQEWEWSENGPEEQHQQRGHQYRPNHDGQQEEYDDQQDSGFNIEFPSYEDQEDVSIGKLTDDNASYDEPLMEDSKQDDDTAANTLETVDLVAEVKRVWRHVQRYEKKKLEKKEAKRGESRNRARNSRGGGNEQNVGQSQSDEYLGTLNEDDDVEERNPMEMMIQQFGDMQNISEIQNTSTSISDQHQINNGPSQGISNNNNRGRRTNRPPTTPMDGRLGKHIRSTSAHSRTHTPATCNSPGLDSNNALPSQASTNGTERDVNFLHEGVDDFFREEEQVILQNQRRYHQERQQYHQQRGSSAQYQGPPTTQSQSKSSRRNQQQQGQDKDSPSKRTMLNKLHRSSPNTLEQYSKSYSVEETDEKVNQDHLLSKPYDMTKTQSSGTGITQRISNTSISPALAQKYIKQSGGGTTNTSSQVDRSQQQQQQQQKKKSSYNQQTQQRQSLQRQSLQQGARLNQSHSKEFQEAFQQRMRKKR